MPLHITIQYNHWDAIADSVRKKSKAIPRKYSRMIRDTAKGFAPVKTGFLRDSIEAEDGPGEFEASAVANAPYAEPVEMGHHTRGGGYVSPQPFMLPAAEALEGPFAEEMARLFEDWSR